MSRMDYSGGISVNSFLAILGYLQMKSNSSLTSVLIPFDNIVNCGCNSAVECLLPKQDVVGSNPITRCGDRHSQQKYRLENEGKAK